MISLFPLYYGLALFWRCGVRAMVDTQFLD